MLFPFFAGNLPSARSEYDAEYYLKMCEKAAENDCDYVVVPFRRENYESMEDFATNIMPSFH